MAKRIGGSGSRLTFLGSFPGEPPVTGLPEIAFAGRSNVGKSSALNALLDSKSAARVSSTPGRTQAINLFQIGADLVFADLPGYGYAKVPDEVMALWKPMVEGYLGDRGDLRLVVVLVDGRHEAQELDQVLLEGLWEARLPTLVVATKLDKLSKHQRKPALAKLREGLRLGDDQPVGFSSRTGEGKDEVWRRIRAAAKGA